VGWATRAPLLALEGLTCGSSQKAPSPACVLVGAWDYRALDVRATCSTWEGTLTDEIITALQASEMFRDLPAKQLHRLRDAGKEIAFTAGSELVVEGEETGRFFLILEGNAEVTVRGKRRGTLGPGTSFGEIALLDGGPRSATVTADTDVRTFSLTSWNFEPFLSEESVTQVVIRSLCRRLRSAEESAQE
jgi:signal-transduction protein with cAMP-binding, CBS, and nucleotidyltransferase domain